jgi:protein SCO1/2
VTGRPRLLLPAAAGLLVLAALAFAILAGSGGSSGSGVSSGAADPFDGAALPAGVPAPLFMLSDQDGRALSLSSLRGRDVVIAFPYTTCRDSCVVVAQQIRGALDELSNPPAVLLVSADPAADTAVKVQRFLERVSLTGRASYLTGTAAELRRVWREYHVTPASAGAAAYAKYLTVLLLDARGDERVLYGPEQLTPEALAHDIRKLEGG